MRQPPAQRARSRVKEVVTPLSSRKIIRSGAIVRIFVANFARRCRLISLSRSLA
jgi:hypothetical protein